MIYAYEAALSRYLNIHINGLIENPLVVVWVIPLVKICQLVLRLTGQDTPCQVKL